MHNSFVVRLGNVGVFDLFKVKINSQQLVFVVVVVFVVDIVRVYKKNILFFLSFFILEQNRSLRQFIKTFAPLYAFRS
jgi:hypothetical protein